ncbi:unnamed protein product [Paramecium pentaurelia]|uniref:Protein HIRA n=1 Tax=Paramecium pentaurelia TaxID=43138 RepID=A0A8S1WRJ8_9CILI|nr:unnamed protein product [Paramecium pentaurelia]
MSVRIKYTSIIEATTGLKSLSLSKKNILALGSGEEEDWLLLNEVDAQFNLHPIQIGKMEKRMISQLAWSPSGLYLATSNDKLIVWQFNGGNLSIYRTYQGHKLEITALCWSPDDQRIATASLDGNIFIYHIKQDGIQHKIDCGQKTVGICWDPFDKYIVSLKFDNTVNFYKIDNWKQEITVSLQIQGKQCTTKREDRKLDWSVDCRYLAVPNLDDKTIPTVAILDRNQNFQVVRTIVGPFSSINVVRFSPMLFKNSNSNEYFSVFAIGDNDGNISLWQINENQIDEQPFLLVKGHKKAGELIEDITWNQQGTVLMATTSKKYIIVIDFQLSLGQVLGENEKQQVIKSLYGDLKNTIKQIRFYQPKINNENIKFADMQIEKINVQDELKNQIPDSAIQQREIPKPTQTQFKQIIVDGKKKLIPLDVNSSEPVIKKVEQQQPLLVIQQYEVLPKSYSFSMNNKILLLEVQKQQQRIFNQAVYGTLIRCIENNTPKWIDYVEGQVKTIQYNDDLIIIYTDQALLYIENHKGMRQEAPFILPFLSQIVLSPKNHILCLQNTGEFKVINLNSKTISYEGDIKILMQHVYEWMDKKQLLNEDEKKGKQSIDPLIKANLKIDTEGYPLVEFLFKDYCVYTYHKQLRQWIKTKQIDVNNQNQDIKNLKKFNFNQYQTPPYNDAQIYKRLIQKTTIEDAINDIQQISKLEEQLKIFWSDGDIKTYEKALYTYIKKLCDTWPNNQEKLSNIIETMITNQNSDEYKYLSERVQDMEELKKKIIYILQQFPQTRDLILCLFPDHF